MNLKIIKSYKILLLIILLITITACSKEGASSDKVKIQFAHYDKTGESQEKVDRFNKMHDDIEVEFLQLPATPTEKFNKFSTWFISESKKPDVLLIDVTWPGMYASAGWIAPIDSYIDEEYLQRFWPVAVEAGQVDGKQYGIQGFIDIGLMYYRTDLLDKYSLKPPVTWEEMVKTTNIIKEKEGEDQDGYLFQGAQIEGSTINFLEMLWSEGGEVENKEGKIDVDTPEAIKAFNHMHNMVYEDKVSPVSVGTSDPTDNENAFGNGNALFMRNWPGSATNLKDTKVDGKFDIAPLPHGEKEVSHPSTGGWMPVINNFSEHKDEAWEFIKFYLSDEEQLSITVNNSQFSSVKSVYEMEEALEAQPLLSDLSDMLKDAKSRPVLRNYEQFSRILQVEISNVLNGGKSGGQAAKDAQKQIDKEINN